MMIEKHILLRGLFALLVAFGLMTWAAVDAEEQPKPAIEALNTVDDVDQAVEALKDERHVLVTQIRKMIPDIRDAERTKRRHERDLESMDKELAFISDRIQYLHNKAPGHEPPSGLTQSFDRIIKARTGIEEERFEAAKKLHELTSAKQDIGTRLKAIEVEMEELKARRSILKN